MKPTEKIKVTSCRYCPFADEKYCNIDRDCRIDENVDDETLNCSCPLKEAVFIVELES